MDAVRTEVMKNRFAAIVEEAASIAYRTAHTTYVKQTQDFQCALTRKDGTFFAFPRLTGVTTGVGQSIQPTIDAVGASGLRPGDVIISNDPFGTRGLCTHSMDIHLIQPVFRAGQLICHAWSFIHASDIGGAVPGSISPVNTEIFQEGIRIRPTKLFVEGRINRDVLNLLQDNCRIPDQVWGDLKALLAGMKTLERRVLELCDRYGEDEFFAGIEDVMDFAEMKARAVIARLPDGSYAFSDYLESPEPGEFVFLSASLTVTGDEALIDFSGSDPQVQAALNFTSGARTHPFLCLALTNYIQTMEPDIPMNGGMFRPIATRAPPGTVMNAEFPAAMGNRWVTAMRMYDVVLGCLNQAIPGGLVAAGAGQAGIISVASRDRATGLRKVSVVEPIVGGSGGRRQADGVDGIDTPIGFLRSAPFEYVELETPLVIRRYSLQTDAHGRGRHRGGAAVVMDMENREVEAVVTVRGLDRTVFQPWGAAGGRCGSSGRNLLNPDGPNPEDLGKIKVLELARGDLLRLITPSGGGFGDPLERDPRLVEEDVRNELLSQRAAVDDHGVVLRDGAVDQAATAQLRSERRAARHSMFDFGPDRSEHESIWPREASIALARAVIGIDRGLRPHAMRALRRVLRQAGAPITADAVAAAVAEWVRQART
ncbi:MAG: hydantoinase B/oxoprolinase family protein [Burkholderiales bacterium]|nr:MAG: hydantoinase B/oxoprolinase family protein [Burkholderiales bacterium]